MSTKQIREWIAARDVKGSDGVLMALILEVIELRARLEKLEAERKRK